MKTKQEIIEYYKKLVDDVMSIDSPVFKFNVSINTAHGMYIDLTAYNKDDGGSRTFYIWCRDDFELEPQADVIKTAIELALSGDWEGIVNLSGH